MSSPLARLTRPRFFYLGSALLLLLLYGRSLGFGYVYDDHSLLTYNPGLLNPRLSWELLARPVLADTSYFRPLVFFSWWLEGQLLGRFSPALSHLVNLLFFYGTLLIFHRLLRRLDLPAPVAAGASLLYLLHPANVEAVAWTSGRFDLFLTGFVLLALDAAVAGRRWLALLAAAAALLSKETAIVLIGLLGLLDMARHADGRPWAVQLRASWTRQRGLYIGLILLDLAYLLLRSRAGGLYHRTLDWAYLQQYWLQWAAPPLALGEYLRQLLWPWGAPLLTPIAPIAAQPGARPLALLLTLALLGGLAWGLKRRQRWPLLALLPALSLVLVLHLLPLNINDNLSQQRFLTLTLPLLTLGLALGWATRPRPAGLGAALLGLGLAYGLGTAATVGVWRDELSFWTAMNRDYGHYFHGRPAKGYFNVLLQRPNQRARLEELLQREQTLSAAAGVPPERDMFVGYADYLIQRERDPAGLRLLEEQLPYYHGTPLWHSYGKYINGLLALENDYRTAGRYLARLENEAAPLFQSDAALTAARLSVNLLRNQPEGLRADWERFPSRQPALRALLNERARASCAAEPRPIPACAADFDFAVYVQSL